MGDEKRISEPVTVHYDGKEMALNTAQSRAVRAYADENGPRVFCVLSPPGSGKTTVAAAMAAEVARYSNPVIKRDARTREHFIDGYEGGKQLLLSVQNVAVDNMGAALEEMDYGVGTVYNAKSVKRLDPRDPAPYDFFEYMEEETREVWKAMYCDVIAAKDAGGRAKMEMLKDGRLVTQYESKLLAYEECIAQERAEFERSLPPLKILFSTVEMILVPVSRRERSLSSSL